MVHHLVRMNAWNVSKGCHHECDRELFPMRHNMFICFTSWWLKLNQAIWKICSSKWGKWKTGTLNHRIVINMWTVQRKLKMQKTTTCCSVDRGPPTCQSQLLVLRSVCTSSRLSSPDRKRTTTATTTATTTTTLTTTTAPTTSYNYNLQRETHLTHQCIINPSNHLLNESSQGISRIV